MANTWYCIRCGRNHREGSHVAWQHGSLRPGKTYDFDPSTVAVGAAMAEAASDNRTGNRASLGDIEAAFESMGLRRAFPDMDVRSKLLELKKRHLVGRDRYAGKEWFEFLANRGSRNKVCSPRSFGMMMKDYASEYERSAIR